MIVQWCLKGLALPNRAEAEAILESRGGLVSSWWRRVTRISPAERRDKLTDENLNYHINHFDDPVPNENFTYGDDSPYISLTSGGVERDAAAKTNYINSALRTALWFGTDFGRQETAYVFTCWVVVAPRAAVAVETVAEEVRDLNTYRRYSEYQTEGEIVAKVIVPDNQVWGFDEWFWDRKTLTLDRVDRVPNPRFTPPSALSNVRELI